VRLGPGLSFSWRRALGVSAFKGRIARCTGIPTTRSGLERKVGRTLIHGLLRPPAAVTDLSNVASSRAWADGVSARTLSDPPGGRHSAPADS
jgi:hypothetical protein